MQAFIHTREVHLVLFYNCSICNEDIRCFKSIFIALNDPGKDTGFKNKAFWSGLQLQAKGTRKPKPKLILGES